MTSTTHTIRANVNVSKLLYFLIGRLWSDVSQMLSAQIDFRASLLEGQGEEVAQHCNLSQTPDSGFICVYMVPLELQDEDYLGLPLTATGLD